ncbi:MAG TPA: carbamoyltransferase C-terminal domain-containing protein [Blastocatellia bacterium]|nr:carbamoyltransferase C-terminal domain-containing protein [Blastocatellia bacterium]
MYILGISGHQRDAASALIKDGRVIAAIEEEKLVRVKRIGISQCGGLPYEAIGYCLESAGIGIDDIDYVTYYVKPRRLLNRQSKFHAQFIPENSPEADDHKAASVNEYHDRLKTLHLIKRLASERSKIAVVDHQLAHAASSFYLSGFDRAATLVLSGKGDYISIAIGVGEGRKTRLFKRVEFPHSLGWLYSLVSEYLGFRANGGEHNTQWLSLGGEPEFLPAFQDLMRIDQAGIPSVDLSYFTSHLQGPDPFSEKFYRQFGDCLRRKDQRFNGGMKSTTWTDLIEELTGRKKAVFPKNSYRLNLAHSLQKHLENVVLALAEGVRREQRVDALCLAGGVTSNSLLASRLERESGYKHIFVQPAAGNAGCSVGAALFQWHNQLNCGRPEVLEDVFLGPEYSDQEIKPVLDNCKLAYRYIISDEKLLDEVSRLLHQGNIVGWFQGRAEFGPRSLGARSILATPLLEHMKENLNLFVKHRETSRPFAASVPEERAEEFFEKCSPLSRFLLTVSRVRNDKRGLIPAAWFSDGMARVHKVSRKTSPLYWRLLNKFGEKAGVPVLVNTSFNLFGEPIVCTPREAVRGYYCSGIDALVINRFLIQK